MAALQPVVIDGVAEDHLGEVVEGLADDGYSRIVADRVSGALFRVSAS